MEKDESKQNKDQLARDANKKINSLKQEYETSVASTESIVQSMSKAFEELYEIDDIHIKIACLKCGGQGWFEQQDKSKVICPVCKGKKYMWALAWKTPVVVKAN